MIHGNLFAVPLGNVNIHSHSLRSFAFSEDSALCYFFSFSG